MALLGQRRLQEPQARVLLQRGQVEQAPAAAEALVGLLDRHHVGVHFGDHMDDPHRIEAPVHADAFVDVVGGDHQLVLLRRPAALGHHEVIAPVDRQQPVLQPRLEIVQAIGGSPETADERRVGGGRTVLAHGVPSDSDAHR